MIIYVIGNQKVLTTFLLFYYLTNYLTLKLRKNANTERRVVGLLLCSGRTSTSCLCSHTDPFAFFKARCRDFQTRKLAWNSIRLRKLHRTRIFLDIILSLCKINYWCECFFVNSNGISSTPWTKEKKKCPFLIKLSRIDYIFNIYFLVLSTVLDDC